MDNFTKTMKNVIQMARHNANVGYSALAQVQAYWEALRRGRVMPYRTEIDPRGLESALEYSFIVERIAPGVARVRVGGSHLADLVGSEVRGMPLGSLLNAPSRRQLGDTLEEVFETPASCTVFLTSPAAIGKPALEARLLLLPLKSDLGDVSRILGAIKAQGPIGAAPRRFDIDRIDIAPILTEAPQATGTDIGTSPGPMTAPDAVTPQPPAPNPLPGFAETAARFTAKAKADAAANAAQAGDGPVPYLRLVKDDD